MNAQINNQPEFRPSALFTDGCVLCRDRELRVFGAAPSGAAVTAELRGEDGRVLTCGETEAAEGRFTVLMPPVSAAEHCRLVLRCGSAVHAAEDVAVGEVWLAGGQSNMELPLTGADGGPAELARHDDPLLRFFDVPKQARRCPEADEAFAAARWQPALPGVGGGVSAVAYWAAKALREHLGVPVGVIDCWWGGTSITCWLPEETLRETAAGTAYLADWEQRAAGIGMEEYLRREAAFQADMDAWNRRVADARGHLPPDAPWADIEAEAGVCPWNPPAGPGSPYRPAGLWDTMLERVMPCALTGFWWYQGEEDTGRTDRYDLLLTALIARWRKDFRSPELPFVLVQLPGWNGAEDPACWARLRLRQEEVRSAVRNTALIVTLDLGDPDNIHPTNKRPVGERLAAGTLRLCHGLSLPESPRPVSRRLTGAAVEIALSAPVRPGGKGWDLFEAAGPDGVWHPAGARVTAEGLQVSSPAVPHPVRVRYAFVNWVPDWVFGENGLPLSPFLLG